MSTRRSLQTTCDELLGYINNVSENVRRFSRDLSPNILEELGHSMAGRETLQAQQFEKYP